MKKNYIDISVSSFKNPHPISGDITLLRDEDVVKENIKNLIFTNFFEKPYSPRYGGNIKRYLFNRINTLETKVMESELYDAIKSYEPRVTDVKITIEIENTQVLVFNVWYTIVSVSEEQFLNLVLDRIR